MNGYANTVIHPIQTVRQTGEAMVQLKDGVVELWVDPVSVGERWNANIQDWRSLPRTQQSDFLLEKYVETVVSVGTAEYVFGKVRGRVDGNGSRVGTSLRDPKSAADFTLAEQLDLRSKHRSLISSLERGDVSMPPGSMGATHPVTGTVTTSPTQLMGELTVATGREVALVRIGDQRLLRLGIVDEYGHGVRLADADRVIAHTHPSGDLRFSVGPVSDMAVFTNPRLNLTGQKSSVLVAPDGTAVRLPIPR